MPNYNRQEAVNYAAKFVFNYNQQWRREKNDCANFVSQALYAGGWTMVQTLPWYLRNSQAGMVMAMERSNDCWFSGKKGSGVLRPSWTWAAAANLGYFLAASKRARKCQPGELALGDVVLINQYNITSHAMIVTAMMPYGKLPSFWVGSLDRMAVPHLSYHTSDKLNEPITHSSPNNLICWKLLDTYKA